MIIKNFKQLPFHSDDSFSFKPTAVSNVYEQYPTIWLGWMLCGGLVITETSLFACYWSD